MISPPTGPLLAVASVLVGEAMGAAQRAKDAEDASLSEGAVSLLKAWLDENGLTDRVNTIVVPAESQHPAETVVTVGKDVPSEEFQAGCARSALASRQPLSQNIGNEMITAHVTWLCFVPCALSTRPEAVTSQEYQCSSVHNHVPTTFSKRTDSRGV
jgi:hypothetical protein